MIQDDDDIYVWKYEEYSDWSRQIAKNYTRKEIEKQLGIVASQRERDAKSAVAAIEATGSMQSQSQRRAQSSNVLRTNYERRTALQNALEIYRNYPEQTKEGF